MCIYRTLHLPFFPSHSFVGSHAFSPSPPARGCVATTFSAYHACILVGCLEHDHSQGSEAECCDEEQRRPGNAPKGTVHLVELHQQLKGIICEEEKDSSKGAGQP